MARTLPIHVAVVCGGPSAEADVSRTSGRCVAEALRGAFSRISLMELEPGIARHLADARVDVVFPALHGPCGEDGSFQGLLEILGIPYVGSGVLASACAMNKIVAKHLFRAHGLPVAEDTVISSAEEVERAAGRVLMALGGDLVVKPVGQGSALGVSFAKDVEDLPRALEEALRHGGQALVERRVAGREITAAVLERSDIGVLPVIEVRTPAGSWYDYDHRYTPGWSEHVIPAPLPAPVYRRVEELARGAHRALGCRDLSRVDFVVPEDGEPVVLEVNTLPGFTPTSLYPDAARAAGIPFEELVRHLVRRALQRARPAGGG